MTIPSTSTMIVLRFAPFHSFRKIPHILLIAIFNAISMLHPKTDMLGRKLTRSHSEKMKLKEPENACKEGKKDIIKQYASGHGKIILYMFCSLY